MSALFGYITKFVPIKLVAGCGDGVVEIDGCVFEDIEDGFKALCAIIVWVGDVIESAVIAKKCCHRENFPFGFDGGRHFVKSGKISTVHADNQVEIIEIGWAHLAADMIQGQSATQRMSSHTRVGQVADMPSTGAGRVDKPAVDPSPLLDQTVHDAIGGRASADISKTDEEHADFTRIGYS